MLNNLSNLLNLLSLLCCNCGAVVVAAIERGIRIGAGFAESESILLDALKVLGLFSLIP